jgi:uncharacterized protein
VGFISEKMGTPDTYHPAKQTEYRELFVFLLLTIALGSPFYAFLMWGRDPPGRWNSHTSHLYMWMPGLAAILTRLIFHRSIRGLGWKILRPRYAILAYAIAAAIAPGTYLPGWLTGFGGFDFGRLASGLSRFGLAGLPRSVGVVLLLVLLGTIGAAGSFASAVGEEFGWRGILVPRLIAITSFPKASLISGSIWAIWHWPLILVLIPRSSLDFSIAYVVGFFSLAVTGLGFVYAWLWLKSKIRPVAILHAGESSFGEFCESLTEDARSSPYAAGEYGLSFAPVAVLLAFIFWNLGRTLNTSLAQNS